MIVPTFLLLLLLVACSSKNSPYSTVTKNGHEMVLVPAGSFVMGIDPADTYNLCAVFNDSLCSYGYLSASGPAHNVYLDDYLIDVYEVTNSQYADCVAAGACEPPAETSTETREQYYGNSEYDDYPVTYVDWEAARNYCTWRDARLPTEAEWEKAARGPESFNYPWGNIFDGSLVNFCDTNCSLDYANSDFDDGYSETAPVGSYPQGISPYGVHDMAGNVFEWVADRYDRYYYYALPDGVENPTGPDDQSVSGDFRVQRGGSRDVFGIIVHTTYRSHKVATTTVPDYGFPCALSP